MILSSFFSKEVLVFPIISQTLYFPVSPFSVTQSNWKYLPAVSLTKKKGDLQQVSIKMLQLSVTQIWKLSFKNGNINFKIPLLSSVIINSIATIGLKNNNNIVSR